MLTFDRAFAFKHTLTPFRAAQCASYYSSFSNASFSSPYTRRAINLSPDPMHVGLPLTTMQHLRPQCFPNTSQKHRAEVLHKIRWDMKGEYINGLQAGNESRHEKDTSQSLGVGSVRSASERLPTMLRSCKHDSISLVLILQSSRAVPLWMDTLRHISK